MCVLITALTLRFLYDDSKAKKSEIIIYAAALILLLPCKSFSLIPVVAFALALVPKLLRKHHISIKSFNKKAVIISVAILAVVFAAAVIVAVKYFTAPERINSNYISWANHTGYTVGYFIQNPNRLVGILIETLMASGDAILLQALGCGLGWLDMSASVLFVLVYVLLLVFASMRKENEDVYIKAGTRAYMWILAAGVCGLAAFAMLIEWTPNTSSLINGLQGRYFIPVIPLALIACRSSHTCTREDSDRIIMMLAVYTQVFLLASVIRNYI
jgi:uncharacterized membrane protein